MSCDILTQERLKELLHYCPDTGVFTCLASRGNRVPVGSVAGGISNGYIEIRIQGQRYKAHRLAWLYVHGTFPPNDIDHINREKTDNRIGNLRPATHAENHQNRAMQSHNTSGYIGVSWYKSRKKWEAYIQLNRKPIKLGYFTDLADAIAARQAAELKYHTFQNS